MPCGVISCSINDDRFLWKCEFCNKKYHAACVGVQRQREHFITAFMVPMCADCQHILRKEADVRKLLHQQEQLVEAIHSQTDANHRIAADLKKFCLVSELFDSIEHLLNDVKETLAVINKNNNNMCSAVGQHMKTCDSQAHATITGINESNSLMSQKITKLLDERLSSLSNDMALSIKGAESSPHHHHPEPKLLEILEEVKFVSGAVSSLQINAAEPHQKTLEEELAESPPVHKNTISPKTDHSSPGWRFLGNKWHWKQDWSKFDAKQRTRRLQEKAAEKAKRCRKRRKQQQIHTSSTKNIIQGNEYSRYNNATSDNNTINNNNNTNNNNNSNNDNNNNNNNNIGNGNITWTSLPLDKELLAAARIQFSGPPSKDSTPKFINFQKGETINPYRIEKPNPPLLDPMRPPVVRLTEQSAAGDRRFLKARLRDPKIMDTVRTYLSFLHNQPPSVCVRGITKTSSTLMLAAEGLPTDTQLLREIFLDVHEELGIPRIDALADLESHRAFLSSERTQRLQHTREAAYKFYSTQNFPRH